VLNPYPPLLALPILLLACSPGARDSSLFSETRLAISRWSCGSAVPGVVAALARFVGMSLGVYREALATFRGMRGGLSLADISLKDVPLRLASLIDSQILFRRSTEVRSGRSDDLWVLGSLDTAWFVVFALSVIGAVVAVLGEGRPGSLRWSS